MIQVFRTGDIILSNGKSFCCVFQVLEMRWSDNVFVPIPGSTVCFNVPNLRINKNVSPGVLVNSNRMVMLAQLHDGQYEYKDFVDGLELDILTKYLKLPLV